MSTLTSIGIYILVFASAIAWGKDQGQRAFDVNSLQSFSDEDIKTPAKKRPGPQKFQTTTLSVFGNEKNPTVQKAQVRIESINVILKTEKRVGQIMLLRTTRGVSYIQLSQQAQQARNKPKANEYLRQAQWDFDFLAKIPANNVKQHAYALYLLGVSKVNLGDPRGADSYLREAIDKDPGAEFAIHVAQYLADQAFVNKRYDEAISYYKHFLNRMTPEDRIQTAYKMGWIYVQAEKPRDAEKVFLALAKTNPHEVGDLRRDCLRELAGLMSQLQSDSAVIAMIDNELKLTKAEKLDFLNDVIIDQMSSEAERLSPALFDRLMTVEDRPVERMRLRLMQLRHLRNGRKLDPDYDKRFVALRQDLGAMSGPDQKATMSSLGREIQHETEVYLGTLVESYAAKLKGKKEPAKSADLNSTATLIRSQIEFLDTTFHVKNRPNLYRLWLDVCAGQENWLCTLDVVKKIEVNPDLASIKQTAAVEKLTAYEGLTKTDEKHYRPQLISTLEDYTKSTNSPDWLVAAKRLSAFYVADKSFDKAVVVLKRIDQYEKNEDSYYHLQLARFEGGFYKDLVADIRPLQEERDVNLVREAYLRVALADAEDTKGSDDRFAEYERAIKNFLKLNKDPKKRLAVLHDYFARLEKRGDTKKLIVELTALDRATRFDASLQEFTRRRIDASFVTGSFNTVVQLIDPPTGVPADLLFNRILAKIALGEKLSRKQLTELTQDQMNYVLGIYTLTSPSHVEEVVQSIPNPDRRLREMAYLALKIKSCDEAFNPNTKQIRLIGDVMPANVGPQPLTASEQALGAIIFAKPKQLSKGESEKMMAVLDSVRQARKLVSAELPKNSPQLDMRILNKAIEVEQQAANMLENAPMPPDLPVEQREQYTAGVMKIAGEFSGQAEEFEKAKKTLDSQVQAAKEKDKIPVHKLNDMATWPWPTSKPTTQVRSDLMAGGSLAALLVSLDFVRTTEKLSDSDYWATRAGILLSKSTCQSMVEYAYNELLAAKQDQLIQSWEKL